MESDSRVAPLLDRLGKLYRDPTRVEIDVTSLLQSSVGVHLHPSISSWVENNGQSSECLVLQGTIAIFYRSVTYELLIEMFLPPGYPMRPPVVYVRLANPNMYLKENHAHVGRDGMVYLPYLSEWKQLSHDLLELVVAMSSIFSDDPPVFTRATTGPVPDSAASEAETYHATRRSMLTTALKHEKCPVCFGEYHNQRGGIQASVVVLVCGHTLHLNCIPSGMDVIHCPICRECMHPNKMCGRTGGNVHGDMHGIFGDMNGIFLPR